MQRCSHAWCSCRSRGEEGLAGMEQYGAVWRLPADAAVAHGRCWQRRGALLSGESIRRMRGCRAERVAVALVEPVGH